MRFNFKNVFLLYVQYFTIRIMEREIVSVRAKHSNKKVDRRQLIFCYISIFQTKSTQLKTKGVGTESNNFEIIKVKEALQIKLLTGPVFCFIALGR